MSRTKKVDLIFFLFPFLTYFLFDLFSFILFLGLGLGLERQDHAVTQQVTSHDAGKNVEGSGRMMLYNM